MRRPRMSTGAWVFATAALVLAVAAPVSYAAATSTVAIGNTTNGSTAYVDTERQLVTVNGVQPSQVVRLSLNAPALSCSSEYIPPAGKGIVITQITYEIGSGTAGTDAYEELTAGCGLALDWAETTQAYDAQSHTFPTGLPMSSIALYGTHFASATVTGYLIPASQLPAGAQRIGKLPARLRPPAHRTGKHS